MGMDGVPRFSEAFPPRDFSCPLFGVSIVWKAFLPMMENCHPPQGHLCRIPGYFDSALERPTLPIGQWFEPRLLSRFCLFFFLYLLRMGFSTTSFLPFFLCSKTVFFCYFFKHHLLTGIFILCPRSFFFCTAVGMPSVSFCRYFL